MYRNRRQSMRNGPRKKPMMQLIWLIGAGVFYFFNNYWPVLLVLIGIIIISTIIWKNLQDVPEIENQPDHPNFPRVDPVEEYRSSQPVIITQSNNTDQVKSWIRPILPSNCSRCGAPIRADDVMWSGSKSAACPYWGSNLVTG